MERCEPFIPALVDHAEGREVPEAARLHFQNCPECRRELELQKKAVACLAREPSALTLARPFLAPVIARRRDRRVFLLAGMVLAVVFLSMHSLLDLEPLSGLLSSFAFLSPFSRTLFQHVGWGMVLVLLGGLGGMLWGLKKALQRA